MTTSRSRAEAKTRSRLRATPAVGYTLIELVLALSLLTLFAVLATVQFSGFGARRQLEHAAEQFKTMLRMAAAEGAQRGRTLRLAFPEETDGGWRMEWEAQPLSSPGRYEAFTTALWTKAIGPDRLRIRRCELRDSETGWTDQLLLQNRIEIQNGPPLHPLTFRPDGSSDSAVLELELASGKDDRTVLLEYDGFNGVIHTTVYNPQQLEEYHAAKAQAARLERTSMSQ